MSVLYFAYGSNLSSGRLRAPDRAPTAELVGTAHLEGYDLRFHKRGRDGTGKCDAYRTGRGGDLLWGVVWRISDEELANLDRAEGVGVGYDRVRLPVARPSGELEVETYVARQDAIDADLAPLASYHAWVVMGAKEHGLPSGWIEKLDRWCPIGSVGSRRRPGGPVAE